MTTRIPSLFMSLLSNPSLPSSSKPLTLNPHRNASLPGNVMQHVWTHLPIAAAAGCINRIELCIEPRQAMWVAYLDIYILDADGSTCDAALTAAVGALELLELPAVKVDETGNVVRSTEGTSAGRRLSVGGRPASVTCGMFQ